MWSILWCFVSGRNLPNFQVVGSEAESFVCQDIWDHWDHWEHWANDSKRSDPGNQSPSLSLLQTLPAVFVSSTSKNTKWTFSGSLVEPGGACCYPTESDCQSLQCLTSAWVPPTELTRLVSLSLCNCFIASHQSSLFIISNVGFLSCLGMFLSSS